MVSFKVFFFEKLFLEFRKHFDTNVHGMGSIKFDLVINKGRSALIATAILGQLAILTCRWRRDSLLVLLHGLPAEQLNKVQHIGARVPAQKKLAQSNTYPYAPHSIDDVVDSAEAHKKSEKIVSFMTLGAYDDDSQSLGIVFVLDKGLEASGHFVDIDEKSLIDYD